MSSAADAFPPRKQNTLKSGDGNGIFDAMEARITKLEEIADDTRAALAMINVKLDPKPDQGWIINLVCVIFGLVLAAIAATAGIFTLIR